MALGSIQPKVKFTPVENGERNKLVYKLWLENTYSHQYQIAHDPKVIELSGGVLSRERISQIIKAQEKKGGESK